MSKKAHTPGPWVIIPAEEYCGDDPDLCGAFTRPVSIEGSDGNPVCTFGSEDGSGTLFENEADYALIASAPEMKEALEPFAEHAKDRCADDPTWNDEDTVKIVVSIGDLRRAAAALSKAKGEG